MIVAYDKKSPDNRYFLDYIDKNHEIYFPVMGGKALGNIPEMFSDMQGDDTGPSNWSELNPYICEISHMYWAWKNMDVLGNPEYIGLSQYRRIMLPLSWTEVYDGLQPKYMCLAIRYQGCSNKNFINKYVPTLKDATDKIILSEFTDQASLDFLKMWENRESMPHYNMFTMHVEEFDRYMQFIERSVEKIQDVISGSRDTGTYPTRAAAWALEYSNGFYLDHAVNVRDFHCRHAQIHMIG